jgi:hypothetical protein
MRLKVLLRDTEQNSIFADYVIMIRMTLHRLQIIKFSAAFMSNVFVALCLELSSREVLLSHAKSLSVTST